MFTLGLSAGAAATHELEPSVVQSSAMDQEQPSFLRPLQFLQAQLQAFTTSSTSFSRSQSSIGTSKQESEASSAADLTSLDEGHSSINSKRTLVCKTKTSYQLAYPPPSPRSQSRFSLRPRLLLQLRKIGDSRRAAPVLEVFTFQRSLRTSVKQHALERGHNLPAEDNLMVLSCDPYTDTYDKLDSPAETSDNDNLEQRGLVASIHRISGADIEHHTDAEIRIGKERWTITKMKSGGYEFARFTEDGDTVKAKWIPQTKKSCNQSQAHLGYNSDRKFKFTLLNPHARKHPIIGSLTRQAIKISDQYLIPGSSISTPKPSSPTSISSQTNSSFTLHDQNAVSSENSIVDTSEYTRNLMLVTGIWVALAEDWLEMDHNNSCITRSNTTPSKFRNISSRTIQSQESSDLSQSPTRNTSTQRPRNLRPFHRHTATALPLVDLSAEATSSTSTLERTRSAGSPLPRRSFKPSKLSLELRSMTQASKSDIRLPLAKPRIPNRGTSALQVPSSIIESPVSPLQVPRPKSGPKEEEPNDEPQDRESTEKTRQGARERSVSRGRSASREPKVGGFLGSTGGNRRKKMGRLLRFMHRKGEDDP